MTFDHAADSEVWTNLEKLGILQPPPFLDASGTPSAYSRYRASNHHRSNVKNHPVHQPFVEGLSQNPASSFNEHALNPLGRQCLQAFA